MSTELWFERYFGPAQGSVLYGECAACAYQGPCDDFRVWHRGTRSRVLCAQCSSDVRATMEHEGWEREEGSVTVSESPCLGIGIPKSPELTNDSEGWMTVGCIADRHHLCQGGQDCSEGHWHACYCPCHVGFRR